jgi:hypothetical protein
VDPVPFWTSRVVCQLLAVVDAPQMLNNVGDVTQTTTMMMVFVLVFVAVVAVCRGRLKTVAL